MLLDCERWGGHGVPPYKSFYGFTALVKAVVLSVLRTSFRVIQPRRAIPTPYFTLFIAFTECASVEITN